MLSEKIIRSFKLLREQEHFSDIRERVEKDSVFQGTNLWVLIFAIFIASLGLNMNSTAVVIGAMLISPLMGPIVGVGVGLAINDLPLIKKAGYNFLFAMAVGLVTSTLYFLITPLDEAHSEILARTQPTVYDVLIALFGGLAGAFALSSKQKGNVVAGVAIATALMPPLCTAGYGLATAQWSFFFGAFYLYIINSVFICAATIGTAYFLKYPKRKYEDPSLERKEKSFIWAAIIITLIPSIYLGYDIIQQSRFEQQAELFISSEAKIENTYLLSQKIDPKTKNVVLTYGGKEIDEHEIEQLRKKLDGYRLDGCVLTVEQGFALLDNREDEDKIIQLGAALSRLGHEKSVLQDLLDSIDRKKSEEVQIFKELRINYPSVKEAIFDPVTLDGDTLLQSDSSMVIILDIEGRMKNSERLKLEEWLKVRLDKEALDIRLHSE